MSEKRNTLGKLGPDAIGTLTLPPLAADLVEGFRALPDLTGMVSDAMDELGIVGVVPASVLRPTSRDARIVGRALTVHNVAAGASVPEAVAAGISGLGEIEAHNLAERGDVLVIQGVDGVSNLGGMSATIGHRQGEIGAVVDGGARDVDHSRTAGYPIWSRSVSPITGKWRVRTVAVNKPVTICSIAVAPGDVVLADEVGVCLIPRDRAREVLERARRNAKAEEARQAQIDRGAPVSELMPKPRAK